MMSRVTLGRVYVIKAGHFAKIGQSTNIDARLGHVRTNCPFAPELVFRDDVGETTIASECVMQAHFRSHWLRAEWFRWDDEFSARLSVVKERGLSKTDVPDDDVVWAWRVAIAVRGWRSKKSTEATHVEP